MALDVLVGDTISLLENDVRTSLTVSENYTIENGGYKLFVESITTHIEGQQNVHPRVLAQARPLLNFSVFRGGKLEVSGLRFEAQEPIRLGDKLLYVTNINVGEKTARLEISKAVEN